MAIWVKICGITSVADALAALDAGADAIGLNLVPSSKRYVPPDAARELHAAIAGRAEVIAVVANLGVQELQALRAATGIENLQLHGHEPPALVEALLPSAFKAVAIEGAADVELAASYPGERLLTDTKVSGVLGGSGQVFDWSLVRDLARKRQLVLAGGLDAENVARAIRDVRPFGVDVASGVETGDSRVKDGDKMRRFVREARSA